MPETVRSFPFFSFEAKLTPHPQPVRLFDIKLLMAALKLLLVGYAADLLFSELCIELV